MELLEQSVGQWFPLRSTCGAGSEGKHAAARGLDGEYLPALLYSALYLPQHCRIAIGEIALVAWLLGKG